MEMTRDEALKVWLPVIQMGVETMPECKEALDMAIKALEQEPTTKNDLGVDCISRFEVTEILNSEYDIDKMLDRVDELPLVTPQEPKIKVLERDEAMRKLGAVDIYQARAWITLLNDLEYLKLKICEVEE